MDPHPRCELRGWRACTRTLFAIIVMMSALLFAETVSADEPSALTRQHLQVLEQLAEQGDAESQFLLGQMHHQGLGVPEDAAKADRWFRLAAAQGHAEALFGLGALHFSENPSDSADLFRLAAEQGHAGAQLMLGTMYASGDALQQDRIEAVRWFRLAAEQGDAHAQFRLGQAYFSGEGIPEDYAESARWFSAAAQQAHAKAQLALALAYATGRGVPEDDVAAYAWASVSAAQGQEQAPELKELVVERMTRPRIEEAQDLSREYWDLYVLPFR